MTVAKVMEALGLKLLTKDVCLEGEVTGGCVCDLLSVVMAEGEAGMAWITVQTHLNVIVLRIRSTNSPRQWSVKAKAFGCFSFSR